MTAPEEPDRRARDRAAEAVDAVFGEETAGGPAEHGPGVRLFAALTGESADDVAADPDAFARGMRVIGDQLRELVGMYFSDDEAQRAAARARFAGLRRTLREHGIAVRVDDDADVAPPPAADRPTLTPPPEDDPGDAFRGRLRGILQGAVDRLESLKDEVLPDAGGDTGD